MATRVDDALEILDQNMSQFPITTKPGLANLDICLKKTFSNKENLIEDEISIVRSMDLSSIKQLINRKNNFEMQPFEIEDILIEVVPKINISDIPVKSSNVSIRCALNNEKYDLFFNAGYNKELTHYIPIANIAEDKDYYVSFLTFDIIQGDLAYRSINGFKSPGILFDSYNRDHGIKLTKIIHDTLKEMKESC